MVNIDILNASAISVAAAAAAASADLFYAVNNKSTLAGDYLNNTTVIGDVATGSSFGVEGSGVTGGINGYVAPPWVFNLTATALFFIGGMGISSNFMAIVVYVFDRSVSTLLEQ